MHWTRSLYDAHSQSVVWRFRRTSIGLRWQASELTIRDIADYAPANQDKSELEVKIVHVDEMTRVRYIRDLSKPVKHLSFDFSGDFLMASSSDGVLHVYDMRQEQPELLRTIEGLIRPLETDVQVSSAVVWHPDGRAFAAPTATRDIQVMSKRDWEFQRSFSSGHAGDITSLAWSPNGSMLVSGATDKTICLWDTKTQKVLQRSVNARVLNRFLSSHSIDTIIFVHLYGLSRGIHRTTSCHTLTTRGSFIYTQASSRLSMFTYFRRICSRHLLSTILWPPSLEM